MTRGRGSVCDQGSSLSPSLGPGIGVRFVTRIRAQSVSRDRAPQSKTWVRAQGVTRAQCMKDSGSVSGQDQGSVCLFLPFISNTSCPDYAPVKLDFLLIKFSWFRDLCNFCSFCLKKIIFSSDWIFLFFTSQLNPVHPIAPSLFPSEGHHNMITEIPSKNVGSLP